MTVLLVVTAFSACGGGRLETEEASSEADRESLERPVERDVFDLLTSAGASPAEARCLAIALTREVDDIGEVFTTENLGYHETSVDVLRTAGDSCVQGERAIALATGLDLAFQRTVVDLTATYRGRLINELVEVGATAEEAACIAREWSDAEARDDSARPVEQLLECGDEDRVGFLLRSRYEGPLVATLRWVGATEEEARCIVGSVSDVDLWFPSPDFYGRQAGESAGEVFVREAARCGSPEQLSQLGLRIHADYTEDESD